MWSLVGVVCVAAALSLQCSRRSDPAPKTESADAGVAATPAAAPATAPPAPTPAWPTAITVDIKTRTVMVPAVVARQGQYKKELRGAIEYALVGSNGKSYESLFVTDCPIDDLHAALLTAGAGAGQPAAGDRPPEGAAVSVSVEYVAGGTVHRRPLDEFVVHLATGEPLKPQPWIFTGSTLTVDPATEAQVLQARVTQSILALHWSDASSLLVNARPECVNQNLYGTNLNLLPPADAKVLLVFQVAAPPMAEGARCAHVFVSGRVQGVGYRHWAAQQANGLGLKGWVRNLADGRVEAIVEGPGDKVAELLQLMERGPRAARVQKVEAGDESPRGTFKEFTPINE